MMDVKTKVNDTPFEVDTRKLAFSIEDKVVKDHVVHYPRLKQISAETIDRAIRTAQETLYSKLIESTQNHVLVYDKSIRKQLEMVTETLQNKSVWTNEESRMFTALSQITTKTLDKLLPNYQKTEIESKELVININGIEGLDK